MHRPSWKGILFFPLVFPLALAAGCGSSGTPKRQPAPGSSGGVAAPATYGGRLPWSCAACPGTDITLTLLPDSTFRLRQTYQERRAPIHHLGRWSVEDSASRLVLRSRPGTPQLLQVVGADSLRLLDTLGRPIESEASLSLVRAVQVDPVRDTMRLRGLYSHMADAGRFTECQSGATFPVAQAGASVTLERAYGGARPAPGVPLLVAVRGHFEERPAMEGDRRLEYLVVDSLERLGADTTCGGRMSKATLENTYWKLLEAGGERVLVPQDAREPNLRLNSLEKGRCAATPAAYRILRLLRPERRLACDYRPLAGDPSRLRIPRLNRGVVLAGCREKQPQSTPQALAPATTGAAPAPAPDSASGPGSPAAASDSTASMAMKDVTWQWVRLTTPVEQLDVDAPDRYTVRFGSDGRIALKADCNRGMGSYAESADRRLTLKPIVLSRAMCPAGSLSDRFAKEVGRATSYFVKDGDLFLELPIDSGTLRFRRQA